MIIRKQFKYNGQHIVRNCSSERCKFSIHSHSYVVEVFFTADGFDNGGMLVDFGLMKGTIKDLVDSFDHAYSMWDKESDDFKDFIYKNSDRYIEMPVTPSAEQYSLMFLYMIDKIVSATKFNNGEKNPRVHSVRVHETRSGYAEAFREDLDLAKYTLEDIKFSEYIKSEWSNPDMYNDLIEATKADKKCFINDIVKQQVI